MNDYTTQGSFYCPLNATAVTVDNAPDTQAFHLEVYKTTSDSSRGVCQVAYSFHQDNVRSWWRNGYGGNWSDWYEVANKEDIASLNNNKANIEHTHGEAYSATTLTNNSYCQVLGNIAIVSWWSGGIDNPIREKWGSLWTLPVTNKGECVWSHNVINQRTGTLYFRINKNSNILEYFFDSPGDAPYTPGQLVFFID